MIIKYVENPKEMLMSLEPAFSWFGNPDTRKYGKFLSSGWWWKTEKINAANDVDIYKAIIHALVEKFNDTDFLADKHIICPVCNHMIGKEDDYLKIYKKQIGAFVYLDGISKPLLEDKDMWMDERLYTHDIHKQWMKKVKDEYGIDAALEIRERYVEV